MKQQATIKSDTGRVPVIPVSSIRLQRKCAACGTHAIGGNSCSECSRNKPTIQRRAGTSGREHAAVPESVQATLRSSGQPLDASTRAFMESRFQHDFSTVRVHTDARAAESAQAVNALAYTVGQDVVFGAGQFAPATRTGQKLLAHELTHVVQQQPGVASKSSLSLGQINDVAEQEADRTADAVLAGDPMPPVATGTGIGSVIRRAGRDSDAPPPPPPVPSQPATTSTCGPDVTAQVSAAVANTRSTFAGWSNSNKRSACDALDSLLTGAYAWDIVELHNNGWILNYRPACASQGATPPCGSTVKVNADCYYAGSPNYVIFGTMCQLCNTHFTAVNDTSAANRFTQSRMQYWINFYKGTGPLGLSTPSGNFATSRDWSNAGYQGWPSGGTAPSGDRNNCAPNCPTAYSGGAFHVNWVPMGVF